MELKLGGLVGSAILIVLAACAPAAQAPAAAPGPAAAPAAPKGPAPAAPAAAPQQPAAPVAAPAPAPAPKPAASKEPSGTLTVAVPTFGQEDWLPRQRQSEDVRSAISDPLYGRRRDNITIFDPSEGLLDSWGYEIKGEAVVTTLVLKKGIPWHNNEGVVTAADLKFSEAHMLKGGTSGASPTRVAIYGGDLNNIEVVNETTIRFHSKLSELEPAFQNQWSSYTTPPMPKAYTERVGEEGYRKQPISTGPFRMVKWIPDTVLTFEAIPNHWRKTPEYKTLIMNKVPESATRLAMLLAGQAAIIFMSPQQAAIAEKNPKIRIYGSPGGGRTWWHLGGLVNKYKWSGGPEGHLTNEPSFYDPKIPWVGEDFLAPDKVKVRKAMDLAFDRQAIVDKLLLGRGRVMCCTQYWDTPGAPWYNPAWKPWPYDPQQARQLMKEAGYPNGFSMNAWLFELENSVVNDDIMEVMGVYWEKELNIRVNFKRAQYNPTVRVGFVNRSFGDHALTYTGPSAVGLAYSISNRPWDTLAYFEHPYVLEVWREQKGILDEKKAGEIARKVGDFIYFNHLVTGVVEADNLWGLRKDFVGEWNKDNRQNWTGSLEWVSKP